MLTVDFRSCKKSWDSLTRKCFACFRPIQTRTRYENKKDSESARNCKYYSSMSTEEQSETLKVAIAYCNESWKTRARSGRKSACVGNAIEEREGRSISANCFSRHDCPTSLVHAYHKRKEEMKAKNFQKKSLESASKNRTDSDDDQERRLDINFLQKQRKKKSEMAAVPTMVEANCNSSSGGLIGKGNGKNKSDLKTDVLLLQDRFDQETNVMVKHRNMLRQIEQELGKKRGNKNPDQHFIVKRQNSEESSTKWTGGNQVENVPKVAQHLEFKRCNPQESSTLWTMQDQAENEPNCAEDKLQKIPEHFKVLRQNSEEKSLTLRTIQNRVEHKFHSKDNDANRSEVKMHKIPQHLKVERRNPKESSTLWTVQNQVANNVRAEDEHKLHKICQHHEVKRQNSEESFTEWTNVQLWMEDEKRKLRVTEAH